MSLNILVFLLFSVDEQNANYYIINNIIGLSVTTVNVVDFALCNTLCRVPRENRTETSRAHFRLLPQNSLTILSVLSNRNT